jgi:hypothetical protein
VRREVFFFPSDADRLYGSLYVSARRRDVPGLVICPSWGFEMGALAVLGHKLAFGLARAGGAGLVFHPPGHGDSTGRADVLDLSRLAAAAMDARASVLDREPDRSWGFAGIGLGASFAALAATTVDCDVLALIQPSLDPRMYFTRLLAAAGRGNLGAGAPPGVAFGHPVPVALMDGPEPEPLRALNAFNGHAIAVVMTSPPPGPLPDRIESVRVRGRWRYPLPNREAARLIRPVVKRLRKGALA